jgi:hypothetical protein
MHYVSPDIVDVHCLVQLWMQQAESIFNGLDILDRKVKNLMAKILV